jgi:hypothetical protein
MKNKDKIIIAFLISVGLFSAIQAVQYVRTLPEKQKNSLMPVIKNSARQRMLNNVCMAILVNGDTKPKRSA